MGGSCHQYWEGIATWSVKVKILLPELLNSSIAIVEILKVWKAHDWKNPWYGHASCIQVSIREDTQLGIITHVLILCCTYSASRNGIKLPLDTHARKKKKIVYVISEKQTSQQTSQDFIHT